MDWKHALFDFSPFWKERGDVAAAFWATIRLSAMTGVLSMIAGTLLAAMRVAPTPVLRAAGTLYVNTVRNTPLTLVLLFCSLGLSDTLHFQIAGSVGSSINYYWLAVFGFSAYTTAFVCEALRSGINTVPFGQAEAARAIGLTFTQSLRLVILPQAFRAVIAPMGSVMIAMIKNSTVVLVASYAEASALMKQMFEEHGATLPVFLGFAIGFMVLTLPTGLIFGWAAKRWAVLR
jgi:glutamate transport system permease protein